MTRKSETTIGRIRMEETDEGDYDDRKSCLKCVHIRQENGVIVCEVGTLDRTYLKLASLNGTYPREVAASCHDFEKRKACRL